ncbi:MAG: hypothetical protein K5886_04310 [Lachnospiraceae bacterium]|nr:hypothetical protein [Lachnospiraceae bacterium]
MDKLLEKKPVQLKDERIQLFALIDRFDASIRQYQAEYSGLAEEEKKDIEQRRSEKEQKLSELRSLQKKEREDALNKHNRALQKYSLSISDENTTARSKTDKFERNYNESVKNENARINGDREKNEEIIKTYRGFVKELDENIHRLSVMLGKSRKGKSDLDRIRKEIRGYIPAITSRSIALSYLSGEVKTEAARLRTEVRELTESLPKKIFLKGKRNEAIKELLTIQSDAQAALKWIEDDIARSGKMQRDASEKRLRSLREDCNRNKQEVIDSKEKTIKELNEKTDRENRGYNAYIKQLTASHEKDYEENERKFDSQIKNAAAKWADEKKKCDAKFVSFMDEQYPGDKMNAWINRFWYHPRSVEDYSKISGTVCLNTLIGMAVLDISDWVSGMTGATVSKVLTNYITLFGRNREQANKSFKEKTVLLPYSISVEKGESLMISLDDDDNSAERAKTMINAISMRLLRSVPACTMRFMLFDAAGMGSFVNLKALDPANIINPTEPTVKSLVISEAREHSHMTKQLAETEISMSSIEGQLISFDSIREFNEANPLSKQIYRPLLMMNFPSGLEQEELRTLNKLIADCSGLGFSMIAAQPDRLYQSVKAEIRPILDEIAARMLRLRLTAGKKGLKVLGTSSRSEKRAEVLLYGLPKKENMEGIISEIRRESVEASRILIRFSESKDVFPQKSGWFTESGEGGVIVPVGYLEGGQPFKIQFDDRHINTLILGNTGSGKTNLLHIMMMNMMLRYDPSEVAIYLIDFKYGLDFSIYTKYDLPNFKTIGIGSDPEYALAMLKGIEKEQQRRSKYIGDKYHKISEYNAANPDDRLNRIIFIIDELYVLAEKADDRIRKEILQLINVLAHQTRAVGIHLVLSGQDLDKLEYFETIKNQCSTRIALKCEDEQVRLLMTEDGVAKMHSIDLTDQGACVFSITGGSNPQIEHTAYIDSAEQDDLLTLIHRHYLDSHVMTDVKIMMSKVEDNINHPLQMFVEKGYITELDGRMLTGDPVSTERELNLKPSGNLWIAGGNISDESSDCGNSVLFFAAYSLMLQKMNNGNTDIICTNVADMPTRNIDDEEKDLTGQLASSYEKLFTYGRAGECLKTLSSLLDELDRRRADTSLCSKSVWWILIKPEMDALLFDNGSFIIDFKELLINGPKYNIHTIMWNHDIKSTQKLITQIDRSLFNERISLEMNQEDMRTVNGSDLKPEPKGYKAVLTGSGRSMLFRVYDLPDGLWMNKLFSQIDSYLAGK